MRDIIERESFDKTFEYCAVYRVINNYRNKLIEGAGRNNMTRKHIAKQGRKCNPNKVGAGVIRAESL